MVTRLFSQKEMNYLNSQRLARTATAAAPTLSEEAGSVQPDVGLLVMILLVTAFM